MNYNYNSQHGQTAASGELQYFANYDELTSKIKSMSQESGHLLYHKNDDTLALGNGDAVVEEDMAEAPVTDAESAAGTENSAGVTRPESHSETYTQVEGVDEADIVKTDGKYIYFSSYEENQIIIAKASKGKAQRVAAISSGKIGSFIEDVYVSENKLIVIGYDNLKNDDDFTTVTIFDITDPKDPEMVRKYSQAGELLSSRLIGSTLCLVTNDYIYVSTPGGFVPRVYYNEDAKKMPIEDICCLPDATSPAYTVVGCMDISAKEI
jgi:Secreted protein containing C-terminal beta-propeller domain distantly related to WD-40 repeats